MQWHARKSEGTVYSFNPTTFHLLARWLHKANMLLSVAMRAMMLFAALFVGADAASAQVQFFGSFQSYNQNFALNAQGLVANAQGNLYVSGSHALGYVPVDANGVPMEASEQAVPGYPSVGTVMGMAIDSSNNIFRADPGSPIGPAVEMFTYQGSPVSFSFGYIGSGWVEPTSVTVDSSGNVYVLDAGVGAIVELTPNGMGAYASNVLVVDGNLLNTTGLSMDSAGDFFVASGPTYGVYPLGAPSLTAVFEEVNLGAGHYSLDTIGSGWISPSATSIDAAGNLWVVDYGANTINLLVPTGGGSYNQTVYQNIQNIRTLMVSQSGRIYGFAYSGGAGDATIWTGGAPPHDLGTYNLMTSAPPATVTVDFMSATTAGSFKVTTQGSTTGDFQATGGTCAPGAYAALQSCTLQVTFTPQAPGERIGALVVTDNNGNILGTNYFYGVGAAPSIAYTPTFSTVIPTASGLDAPSAITVDQAGNVYVVDPAANTLSEFAGGSPTPTILDTNVARVTGITIDGAGNIWMAECTSNDIVLETPTGQGTYARSVQSFGGFDCPTSVAVDGSGDLYIAQNGGGAVLKETLTDGSYAQSTVVSSLGHPSAVAVDSSNNLYVADTDNNQVLEETPSGSTYTQTVVATAGLSAPNGLAIDPNGNVYISNSGDTAIVKATKSGSNFTPSVLPTPGLVQPAALALDTAGDLYIADQGAALIAQLNVSTAPSLAFANTVAGSISTDSPTSATISNYGNTGLVISSITLPTGFVSDGSTCVLTGETLAANAQCNLGIDFAPTSGTHFSGPIVLWDNNLDQPVTQNINLSGTGLPDVVLTPASETLAAGTVGSPYSQTFTAGGGVSPYALAAVITSGSLPAGMTFTGQLLSGIPSATGTVTFTIVATDSSSSPGPYSSTLQTYSLTINPAPVVLSLSPVSLPDTAFGLPYIQAIAASGGSGSYTYAITSGSLPSGISLNVSSGVLSGVPTATGPSAFTLTATDTVAQVTASQSYTPTVYPVAAAAPAQNAGSSNIGSPASTTTLTFTFNVPANLANLNVVTQGVANQDFANAGTGTCTAGAYLAGNTCTVDVTFTPQLAGSRNGAVLLEDGAGNVLGTGFVFGTGTGPQLTYAPGTESTVASAAAPFNLVTPTGAAVDAAGNVYIADYSGGAVYKETLVSGTYTQSIVAAVPYATGVALDGAGSVYIAQGLNSTVYKETPSGSTYTQSVVTSSAGVPVGVAVDGNGNVFVVDADAGAVHELSLSSGAYVQSTVIASGLSNPQGIAMDASGNLYIADQNDRQVWKETLANGSYTPSPTASGLGSPSGVALDASGNLYISDYYNGQIVKETWSGTSYTQSTLPVGSAIQPYGVALDASGNLYIADGNNGRVLKEDYADAPTLTFANPTPAGSADTENPLAITLLNSGNAPLALAVPGTGTNPAIANRSFTLDAASTCPSINAGGTAVNLAANASCTYAIDFTPQQSGQNPGTLTLYDNNLNNSSASQPIALTGTGTGPSILLTPAAGTLAAATAGQPYRQTFTATGGSGSFTFLSVGSIPAGLLLSPTGILSGTPTTAGGPLTFTVTATDEVNSAQASQSYTLSVQPGVAAVMLAGLSQTYTGSALVATATTVPAGLSVNFTYTGSSTPPTAVGTYPVVATIHDPSYTGTASGTLTIVPAATAIVLASSTNPAALMNPIMLTATMTSAAGTPFGQVSFLDGTTPLGSVEVSGGVASLTIATLAAGTHALTAIYAPTANFVASTSNALSLSVVDLSLAAPGGGGTTAQTTAPGGTATYTIPLAPSIGVTFPSPITLSVAGLPPGATASLVTPGWTVLSTTSWTLPANLPVGNISLTLTAPIQTASNKPNGQPTRKLPLLAVGLLLLPLARKSRKASKRMTSWLCLLLMAAGLTAAAATTGCGSLPATPPQTYNVTVTVTAGALTHSTPLTLTVK